MNKIKLWADSLDKNFAEPNESFMFIKDLITYDEYFKQAGSIKDSDVIVIPQYSNNYINNLIGNYVFDKEKADLIFNSGKLIIVVNTGGGCPYEWEKLPIYEYLKKGIAKKTIIFSTECHTWHREHFPKNVLYLPYEYIGFVDFGLGLLNYPSLQSKYEYIVRPIGTAAVMNRYAPTRDILWDLLHEQNEWEQMSYQTTTENQKRIDWNIMIGWLLNSKIGFSPDGATGKTERHVYIPSYTAMMMQDSRYLEFSYEWVDGVNCLKMVHDFTHGCTNETEISFQQNEHRLRILNKEKTKEKILHYLRQPEILYDIYVNGWHNQQNYTIPNYNKNYIGKTIKENI